MCVTFWQRLQTRPGACMLQVFWLYGHWQITCTCGPTCCSSSFELADCRPLPLPHVLANCRCRHCVQLWSEADLSGKAGLFQRELNSKCHCCLGQSTCALAGHFSVVDSWKLTTLLFGWNAPEFTIHWAPHVQQHSGASIRQGFLDDVLQAIWEGSFRGHLSEYLGDHPQTGVCHHWSQAA